MNAQAEFGKVARDALNELRKLVTRMKKEGDKVGTDGDNRQVRDAM